ncbi:MAG: hypothetical protein NTW19_06295 [Planctomycetota bacterium]|nr:hypothetical protein [Planctomycetota bacterium]
MKQTPPHVRHSAAHRVAFFGLVAAAFAVALAALATPGCASIPSEPGSPAPPRLSLSFRAARTDGKLTYFEIAKDGQLSFAGGRDAMHGSAQPVVILAPEQRQAVWDIITRNRLLDAKGTFLAKATTVTYDLTIDPGSGRHTLRSIDEETPGLAELQKTLFEYQAKVRYKIPGLKQ